MVNPSLGSVRDIRNNSLGNSNNIGHNHLKLNSLSHNSNDNTCKNNVFWSQFSDYISPKY
jgi:hypothetical protein